MIKLTEWIEALKHLAFSRTTEYINDFPYNCGYICDDGKITFDCIGLVKSLINEIGIAYKTGPAGYYVTPNQAIPDTTEKGILDLCSDVSNDFKNLAKGEYLCMYQSAGHAGVYVGEINHEVHGTINVIECTPAFGGGVTTSWVDENGVRYNRKGGYSKGQWEAHGKLSKYINYTDTATEEADTATADIEANEMNTANFIAALWNDRLLPVISEGCEYVYATALLQTKLKELGYYVGEVDGSCGSMTKAAIITYQAKNGLEQDGYFGKRCWTHILGEG